MLLYFDFNVELPRKFMEDWSQVIYDHFTYAIVMMNNIEIIDALSFAYYNLTKV